MGLPAPVFNLLSQLRARYAPQMPSGLNWDTSDYPIGNFTIADIGHRCIGQLSFTPEGFFDNYSTARSAPGATFYVDIINGLDTNNGLTSGAAFRSIWKAVSAANAANVPTTINCASGVATPYYRQYNFSSGGGTTVYPTVDIAFIATGGRCNVTTHDDPGTPSRDATYTNTYSYTLANAERVCDTSHLNEWGNYLEFNQVSTAPLCNSTPNSWALVSGTIYINRGDQQAVGHLNTRVYRAGGSTNLLIAAQVNIYLGGNGVQNCGFDLEGGSGYTAGSIHYPGATLDCYIGTPTSAKKVIVAVNSSFKYGGGYATVDGRSVSCESWNGLDAYFNCRADAGQTDGFNKHNTNAASSPYRLTVNCSANDNGRPGNVSNNSWTTHDNIVAIDICGHYRGSHGGQVASIQTSKSWLAGTTSEGDKGDLTLGGTGAGYGPTEFMAEDTATYWCDRTKAITPAGGAAYVAKAAGSTVLQRNVWTYGQPNQGPGTFGTY